MRKMFFFFFEINTNVNKLGLSCGKLMEGILLGAFYLAQKRGQDLSKYTVPTSFAGMSIPTTVVGMLVVQGDQK